MEAPRMQNCAQFDTGLGQNCPAKDATSGGNPRKRLKRLGYLAAGLCIVGAVLVGVSLFHRPAKKLSTDREWTERRAVEGTCSIANPSPGPAGVDGLERARRLAVGKPTAEQIATARNTQRVSEIIGGEAGWDYLFPMRHGSGQANGAQPYTFDNFLAAVTQWPEFCGDKVGPYYPNDTAEIACRRELATLFANFAQEVGAQIPNQADGIPTWRQALYWLSEIGCTDTTCSGYAQCTGWAGEAWPCTGRGFFGRGPYQLSWNYNYGPFSTAMFGDASVLLAEPNLLLDDGWLAFASALWFFMTPQAPKPSGHDVVYGHFIPSEADVANGRLPGFGAQIMIINGGLECGSPNAKAAKRVGFWKNFAAHFGVSEGENLDCASMRAFDTTSSTSFNGYWTQAWSGACECQLVSWATPDTIFDYPSNLQNSYCSCLRRNFGEEACQLTNTPAPPPPPPPPPSTSGDIVEETTVEVDMETTPTPEEPPGPPAPPGECTLAPWASCDGTQWCCPSAATQWEPSEPYACYQQSQWYAQCMPKGSCTGAFCQELSPPLPGTTAAEVDETTTAEPEETSTPEPEVETTAEEVETTTAEEVVETTTAEEEVETTTAEPEVETTTAEEEVETTTAEPEVTSTPEPVVETTEEVETTAGEEVATTTGEVEIETTPAPRECTLRNYASCDGSQLCCPKLATRWEPEVEFVCYQQSQWYSACMPKGSCAGCKVLGDSAPETTEVEVDETTAAEPEQTSTPEPEVETTAEAEVETTRAEEVVETTSAAVDVQTTPPPEQECTVENWAACDGSACCKDDKWGPGQFACYKRSEWYAQCRPRGPCPDETWSCEELGADSDGAGSDGAALASEEVAAAAASASATRMAADDASTGRARLGKEQWAGIGLGSTLGLLGLLLAAYVYSRESAHRAEAEMAAVEGGEAGSGVKPLELELSAIEALKTSGAVERCDVVFQVPDKHQGPPTAADQA